MATIQDPSNSKEKGENPPTVMDRVKAEVIRKQIEKLGKDLDTNDCFTLGNNATYFTMSQTDQQIYLMRGLRPLNPNWPTIRGVFPDYMSHPDFPEILPSMSFADYNKLIKIWLTKNKDKISYFYKTFNKKISSKVLETFDALIPSTNPLLEEEINSIIPYENYRLMESMRGTNPLIHNFVRTILDAQEGVPINFKTVKKCVYDPVPIPASFKQSSKAKKKSDTPSKDDDNKQSSETPSLEDKSQLPSRSIKDSDRPGIMSSTTFQDILDDVSQSLVDQQTNKVDRSSIDKSSAESKMFDPQKLSPTEEELKKALILLSEKYKHPMSTDEIKERITMIGATHPKNIESKKVPVTNTINPVKVNELEEEITQSSSNKIQSQISKLIPSNVPEIPGLIPSIKTTRLTKGLNKQILESATYQDQEEQLYNAVDKCKLDKNKFHLDCVLVSQINNSGIEDIAKEAIDIRPAVLRSLCEINNLMTGHKLVRSNNMVDFDELVSSINLIIDRISKPLSAKFIYSLGDGKAKIGSMIRSLFYTHYDDFNFFKIEMFPSTLNIYFHLSSEFFFSNLNMMVQLNQRILTRTDALNDALQSAVGNTHAMTAIGLKNQSETSKILKSFEAKVNIAEKTSKPLKVMKPTSDSLKPSPLTINKNVQFSSLKKNEEDKFLEKLMSAKYLVIPPIVVPHTSYKTVDISILNEMIKRTNNTYKSLLNSCKLLSEVDLKKIASVTPKEKIYPLMKTFMVVNKDKQPELSPDRISNWSLSDTNRLNSNEIFKSYEFAKELLKKMGVIHKE